MSSLGEGLDSMYHAMLTRVFDTDRYGPQIVAMLRRVLMTVLICEEPVTIDGRKVYIGVGMGWIIL